MAPWVREVEMEGMTPADLFFWLGVALALVAGVCHFLALRASSRADAMKDTPTSPAGKILGPGYFEVKGTIGCGDPLEHPETERKLVHYIYRILEVWEHTWSDRGRTRTERYEEILEEQRRHAPFWIQDASGRIEVDPTEAELDVEVLMAKRLEAEPGATAAAYGRRQPGTRRRLERRKEMVGLEVGQWVYCIGPVRRTGEALVFQGKDEEDRPFLISSRTEEDQLASFGNISRIYNAAAVLSLVLGLLLLLVSRSGLLPPPA